MNWLYPVVSFPKVLPFLGGWLADRLWGDPEGWFHPVVWFGKVISAEEKKWNNGADRVTKGAVFAFALIAFTFAVTHVILHAAELIHPVVKMVIVGIGVFYGLAGKTLADEVKAVFEAVERSIEEGRLRVARIVGRDTSGLSPQEIRTAALETLSENLSDGVVAPMFWFMIGGLPGMMAYKMVNTLDSMIGYKNERYREFGRPAALIDDVANYIPARLTACLMLLVARQWKQWRFVQRFGPAHASPNSGYPEAALAAILNCRFGGTHDYFGRPVEKPYIGTNDRLLTSGDMKEAIRINGLVELVMGMIVTLTLLI